MTRLDVSWLRAWNHLGREAPEGLKQQLLAAYGEPQRHYHTQQHLIECIALLDSAIERTRSPGEVELALWFHDAVYQPKAKDNEERSAEWAARALVAAGVEAASIDRVHALVMATRHEASGKQQPPMEALHWGPKEGQPRAAPCGSRNAIRASLQ